MSESPDFTQTYEPTDRPSGDYLPGTLLAGRYRIVALLGRGGMGEVYRADDLTLGGAVAIKFLPELMANDPGRLTRFRREAAEARKVSDRHVCRVYDIGEVDGKSFLTMEFIDGEDLGKLLKRVGRLAEEKALEIAQQLCSALVAVHEAGLIHRDLKPGNVMLDGRGEVRLADFGLMINATEARDVRSGTPLYMAPEQLSGAEVTVQSDLFSLGLVLYEVFTGKRPFTGLDRESPPSAPSSSVPGLDPDVERIILRCLEIDPKSRPRSAIEVLKALKADPLMKAQAEGRMPSPEVVANAADPEKLSPQLALIALTGTLAGLVLVLLLYGRVMLVGRVGLPKPTDVLAHRAAEILRQGGFPEGRDRAFGYDHDVSFLSWVTQVDTSPNRWDRLHQRPAAAVYFWYRESPALLVPHLFYPYAGSIEPSRITWHVPAPTTPGMTAVRLDLEGRLLQFLTVPPNRDAADSAAPLVADYGPWFAAARIDAARFSPVEPNWLPPVYADHRDAWTGSIDEGDDPVRVEAASYRGRVVAFRVVAPWTEEDRENNPQGLGDQGSATSQFHLFVVVLLAALILGPRHLRNGQADAQGAFRLGVIAFVLQMVVWAVETHHVWDRAELELFVFGFAFAGYWAIFLWLSYLALEPYVRRWWPRAIVSWTRLLSGRAVDPLVGRDLLIGALGGVLVVLIGHLGNQVPACLGEPAPTPWWDWWVPNTQVHGYWVGNFLMNLAYSFRAAFFFNLLFLLMLRVIFRKPLLAGVAYVGIWTIINAHDLGFFYPTTAWIFLGTINLLLLGLMVRFGALALITAAFVTNTLWFPMTTDPQAWYAPGGYLALGVVAFLAGYGYHTANATPQTARP